LLTTVWITGQLCMMGGCQTARVSSGGATDEAALMSRGAAAMRAGNATQAIACWTDAETKYAASGSTGSQFDALIDLTAAYEAMGKFEQAEQPSDQAAALLPLLHSPARQLTVLLTQADLYTFTHREAAAEDAINEGLTLSRRLGMTRAEAGLENALGNVRVRQGQFVDAVTAYALSATLAGQSGDHAQRARALANAATAAARLPDPEQTIQFSRAAMAEITPMQTGRQKLTLLLTVGQSLESPSRTEAERIYLDAATEARATGDQQSLSYALGYEGRLLQSTGRADEALQITRQAAFISQNIQDPQASYRWERQIGQFLAERGDLDGAIAAYESAVTWLEPVRLDLTLGKGTGTGGTFQQNVGPTYYELADLLLRRADGQPDSQGTQELFRKAQQTVEQLKSAQLEDYFQDRCEGLLKGRSREIGAVDPHTAVIYFISLPDRTEILVSIGNHITRFTARVTAEQLKAQTIEFRHNLENRNTRRYLYSAQTLYDWLLRPLEPTLRGNHIDTLAFVPDGFLRTIPLAALHDGHEFLIAHYAVAVSPGLTLMDPQPIERRSPLVLEGGLSQAVFEYPALPYVKQELDSLHQLYAGRTLLDQSFIESNLRSELIGRDYTIVHIASHVEFGDNARTTYLVTYQKKLNLDAVETLILPTRYRDRPLELLTLDCCNTAADDEKSAQGMAGAAIEAGARSAVATLWPVDDEGAAMLIEDFYATLRNNPNMSKAKAMQHAQLLLLQDQDHSFRHPEYWAPYLVIGNWL